MEDNGNKHSAAAGMTPDDLIVSDLDRGVLEAVFKAAVACESFEMPEGHGANFVILKRSQYKPLRNMLDSALSMMRYRVVRNRTPHLVPFDKERFNATHDNRDEAAEALRREVNKKAKARAAATGGRVNVPGLPATNPTLCKIVMYAVRKSWTVDQTMAALNQEGVVNKYGDVYRRGTIEVYMSSARRAVQDSRSE